MSVFMIYCSFGNGLRLTGDPEYKEVIVEAARSLSTRFRPVAGIIQSWDVDRGWISERGWECPVIIDNMYEPSSCCLPLHGCPATQLSIRLPFRTSTAL